MDLIYLCPPMLIVKVQAHNEGVYLNLAQGYEAEFSALTQKRPEVDGRFRLDTLLGDGVTGFILEIDAAPAGIAAIAAKPESVYEVCEFYVVPSFRKQGWGTRFAHELWRKRPGSWEVKQILGAGYATVFWRKAIEDFGCLGCSEETFNDPYWGEVTRQRFVVSAQAIAASETVLFSP
jgi:predicted acetyltransferase